MGVHVLVPAVLIDGTNLEIFMQLQEPYIESGHWTLAVLGSVLGYYIIPLPAIETLVDAQGVASNVKAVSRGHIALGHRSTLSRTCLIGMSLALQ